MANKDPQNQLAATVANDKSVELMQIVIDWYRSNRSVLTSTQVTNLTTEIGNVLNGTHKV